MLGPLVSTDWLAAHLNEAGLRIADVRWYLDPAKKGRDAYAAGHIPGAVFLDIDADLSAPGGGPGKLAGRHPWPRSEQVALIMGRAGIGEGMRVIAYDDLAGGIAARLWYLLRAHGHDDVAVLDGGLPKWLAEGRPIDADVPPLEAREFRPHLRSGFVVAKPEMIALVRESKSLVLDARAAERYRGDSEPIDLRAGHIPGATNAPFALNLTEGPIKVLRPAAELRDHYAALGAQAEPPVVYCGSGVTACHDLLALEVAGLRGRLYAGSWSEWSADPELPVEKG